MLDRALLDAGYRQLCENWRRKPSDAQAESWYRSLEHKLHDDQFRDAIEGVIEGERSFPALATLLEYGRASTRHRRMKGVPHIRGGMRLRTLLEEVEEGRSVEPPKGWWPSVAEEYTYLNAVEAMREEYELPSTGEEALAFLELVSMRARGKLSDVPTPTVPVREMPAPSMREQQPEGDDADGFTESAAPYREDW
jgi:hypothetical protein